jgi:hypothetical protein
MRTTNGRYITAKEFNEALTLVRRHLREAAERFAANDQLGAYTALEKAQHASFDAKDMMKISWKD